MSKKNGEGAPSGVAAALIAMLESDHPRETVRNRTSLSAPTWTIYSTVVQPVGCLKGQPAQ